LNEIQVEITYVVHTVDVHRDVSGSGDDNKLGTTLQVLATAFLVGKDTRGFDDKVSTNRTPRNVSRIATTAKF